MIKVHIFSFFNVIYKDNYDYANNHESTQQPAEIVNEYDTGMISYPQQIPYPDNATSQYYEQQQSSINALPPLFTSDQLDRELFAMFDLQMQGFIDSRDLETIGRAMGWKTDQSKNKNDSYFFMQFKNLFQRQTQTRMGSLYMMNSYWFFATLRRDRFRIILKPTTHVSLIIIKTSSRTIAQLISQLTLRVPKGRSQPNNKHQASSF